MNLLPNLPAQSTSADTSSAGNTSALSPGKGTAPSLTGEEAEFAALVAALLPTLIPDNAAIPLGSALVDVQEVETVGDFTFAGFDLLTVNDRPNGVDQTSIQFAVSGEADGLAATGKGEVGDATLAGDLQSAQQVSHGSTSSADAVAKATVGFAGQGSAERTALRALGGNRTDDRGELDAAFEQFAETDTESETMQSSAQGHTAPLDPRGAEDSLAEQLITARLALAYQHDEQAASVADMVDVSEPHDVRSDQHSLIGAAQAGWSEIKGLTTDAFEALEPLPVADQVAEAIAAELERAGQHGTLKFEIQLDPPELGQVMVRIERSAETLVAHLTVEDESVQQLVRQQMQRLQDMLRESGVQFDQFDVSYQQQNMSGHSWREQPESNLTTAPVQPAVATASESRTLRLVQGRLDVRA